MVPLNYSFGRLFCKFSILLLSIFLLFWIFLDKQQLSIKTEDLEVQLRFANEHISSLSAQINVISKHKDRIEALSAKEKERCIESINIQSKRINILQTENIRLNSLLLENVNQQKPLEKQINSSLNNESSIVSPIILEKEQRLEDPFENKKKEINEANNNNNIPIAQIKSPPNIEEQNNDKRKDSLLKEDKKEPNGGEKHLGEDYNIFRRQNKPFEDLIFKRENDKKLIKKKIDNNNNNEENEGQAVKAEDQAVKEEKEEKEYVEKDEKEANN